MINVVFGILEIVFSIFFCGCHKIENTRKFVSVKISTVALSSLFLGFCSLAFYSYHGFFFPFSFCLKSLFSFAVVVMVPYLTWLVVAIESTRTRSSPLFNQLLSIKPHNLCKMCFKINVSMSVFIWNGSVLGELYNSLIGDLSVFHIFQPYQPFTTWEFKF